jgi:outer membrane usher protein
LLERLDINFSALAPELRAEMASAPPAQCFSLQAISGDASYAYTQSDFRLTVSIPQALMARGVRGYVDPALWDAGGVAATMRYTLNGNVIRSASSGTNSQAFFNADAGLHLGSWHLRQNFSVSAQPGSVNYQSSAAYAQHDIPSWRSQLVLGNVVTDGEVFDSYGIRGAQLGTDDRMLPESQTGYAPVISGTARTNARVTVMQNGTKLYETTVSPGPFRIDDLYPTGYGGDLEVTVTESDGAQRSFTVPYAALPSLLRPGYTRFNVSAGSFRNGTSVQGTVVVQGVVQHGFSNTFTGYGGLIGANGYGAVLAGATFNTSIGALGVDVTQTTAALGDYSSNGRRIRLRYSERLTNPDIVVSANVLRNSAGYWSTSDALTLQGGAAAPEDFTRARGQYQFSISRIFAEEHGTLMASGSWVDYGGARPVSRQFQMGYNNSWKLSASRSLGYSVSFSRQFDSASGLPDNQFTVNLSMPLGGESGGMVSAGVIHDDAFGWTSQVQASTTLGEQRQYAIGAGISRAQSATSATVSGSYQGSAAQFSATAGVGPGYTQASASVSGGVVLHPHGVVFANNLGDTVGLIEADGAEGASISGAVNSRVDASGYAVVPYLMPYRMNQIHLDPANTSPDTQFESTSQQVAPRANSVVTIHFATITGRSAIIAVKMVDGAPAPFGADVVDAKGASVGIIGAGGSLFAAGLEEAGELIVKLGNGSCRLHYQLPPKDKEAIGYPRVEAVCGEGK